MTSRRSLIAGSAAVAAATLLTLPATAALAQSRRPVISAKRRPEYPKLVEGEPKKLDFGDGLLIPLDASIFKSLWEGSDRWIVYAHAGATRELRARERAIIAAEGKMKHMLLTLAFAPDRLERVEGGGWRLKSGRWEDMIRGDVPLPGKPVSPTLDDYGSDSSSAAETLTHATTGYMVMKSDVDLDYVRKRARLVDPS